MEEIVWDDDIAPDEEALSHVEHILDSPLWGVKTEQPVFRVQLEGAKYALLGSSDLQEILRISNEIGQKGHKVIGYEFIHGGKGVSLIYEKSTTGMSSVQKPN